MKKVRPWMLVYLLFFLALSLFSVKNDVENQYPIFYVFLGSFAYVTFNAGIMLYAINYRTEAIRFAWRFLFPFLIAYFLVSFLIDSVFGMNANLSPQGLVVDILIFAFGTIIFVPAFRASFILAYGTAAIVSEPK